MIAECSCGGSPLRVALVYDDSLDRHAGLPQHLTMLTRGLTRLGHRVTLLVGQSSTGHIATSTVHSLAHNVAVRFNGNALSVPILARAGAVDEVLRSEQFDVVHVQVPYSPLMAGRVIRRLDPGTALVGTFHVVAERWHARYGARALATATRRSLARFDGMLAVSACAAAFAERTYGLRATVVPNFVDVATLGALARSSPVPEHAGPIIVFLGALVPRKGADRLLDALALMQRRLRGTKLVIAGDGPMRTRLERRARRADIVDGSVRFVGAVSEREKVRVLGMADVACFPSRFGESFGIVLLEAIAAGAGAVVAGRNAGYEELFSDCTEAVCDSEPEPLAALLLELCRDEVARGRLGRLQRRLLSRYDMPAVTARIVEAYRAGIVARRGHASPGESVYANAC